MDFFKYLTRSKTKNIPKEIKTDNMYVDNCSYFINKIEYTDFRSETIKEVIKFYIINLGTHTRISLDVNMYSNIEYSLRDFNDLKYLLAIDLANSILETKNINHNIRVCLPLKDIMDRHYKRDKVKSKDQLIILLKPLIKAELIESIVTNVY